MENFADGNTESARKMVVRWDEAKGAFLCPFGTQDIEIAFYPQSEKEDAWTPEEMFVVSIAGFIREAFIDAAGRIGVECLSYETASEWTAEKTKDRYEFSEIRIRPHIVVAAHDQIEKAEETIELVARECFISNFVMCKISIDADIEA